METRGTQRNNQTPGFDPATLTGALQQSLVPTAAPVADFEALGTQVKVEHISVPGFMKRVPFNWHIEDLQRFGTVVGKTADALQLAYLTATDRQLGMVRVFPAGLLERVYEILAPQFHWPAMVTEAADLKRLSPAMRTLRVHRRLTDHLKTMQATTEDDDLKAALNRVLQTMGEDEARMADAIERAMNPGTAPEK